MIKIFNDVNLIDNNFKRVIISAFDRAFKDTKGKIPLMYKDEVVGYCFKYTIEGGFNVHTEVNKKIDCSDVIFLLKDSILDKVGEIAKTKIVYLEAI